MLLISYWIFIAREYREGRIIKSTKNTEVSSRIS